MDTVINIKFSDLNEEGKLKFALALFQNDEDSWKEMMEEDGYNVRGKLSQKTILNYFNEYNDPSVGSVLSVDVDLADGEFFYD